MHRISQPKEADPAGDLILVIGSGKDQESVLVSSRVLSLASPVLAAVSSRFAEGHSLADPISSEIPKISLPEDDPEALTWLCEALHFKKRVTEGMSFSLLKRYVFWTSCSTFHAAGRVIRHISDVFAPVLLLDSCLVFGYKSSSDNADYETTYRLAQIRRLGRTRPMESIVDAEVERVCGRSRSLATNALDLIRL